MRTLEMDKQAVKAAVRERYGQIAADGGSCGCAASCCSGRNEEDACQDDAYSDDEAAAAPAGSNLGLGCGNPHGIAGLQPGETVVDLGSGAGFDAFLAARAVGESGRVIGVDMTPEMVARAEANRIRGGFTNVEFRLGEIENLPLPNESVDAVISNCVVNLSPDKPRVLRQAYRVLRPAGRLAIADLLASTPLPPLLHGDAELLTGCIAGAVAAEELRAMLEEAGFTEVRITFRSAPGRPGSASTPRQTVQDYVAAATIEAIKPKPKPAPEDDADSGEHLE